MSRSQIRASRDTDLRNAWLTSLKQTCITDKINRVTMVDCRHGGGQLFSTRTNRVDTHTHTHTHVHVHPLMHMYMRGVRARAPTPNNKVVFSGDVWKKFAHRPNLISL